MIRLRSEPARETDAAEWLKYAVREFEGREHLLSATVLSRVGVTGDISVHLEWEFDSIPVKGSDTGLEIAHALGSFGLLDHSVWAERLYEGAQTTAGGERGKRPDWKRGGRSQKA